MAPRARRETKAKSNKQVSMTEEKWLSMKQFGSFVVADPDSEEGHKFAKDETASILPHTIPPGKDIEDTDYWIAKIKDIRAELHDDGTNTVWVKVQWFYSAKDVANVVKSFDESTVGEYERVFSDHFDFVGPECFNAITPIARFNENDPEPPFIPWDSFYQRYDFEYKARTIKPKPGSSSCICNLPYDPNDKSPSSIMHFCPRPSCRRAYHHRCLVAAKSKESSTSTAAVAVAESSTSSSNKKSDGDDDDVIFSNPPPATPRKHSRATRSSNNTATDNDNDNDNVIFVSTSSSPTKRKRTTTQTQNQNNSESTTLSAENPLYSRSFRLLTCSPDTDENVDLASLIPLSVSDNNVQPMDVDSDTAPAPSKKTRRRSARKSTLSTSSSITKSSQKQKQPQQQMETEVKPSRTLADALGAIPYDLLHVAEQPLIRGAAFANGGVSGNVAFVTRARRLVYHLVEGGTLPDGLDGEGEGEGWEGIVFGWGGDDGKGEGGEKEKRPGMSNAIVKIGTSKKQLLPFVCPSCKSAI